MTKKMADLTTVVPFEKRALEGLQASLSPRSPPASRRWAYLEGLLGIYESKVVRSEKPGAMKGWLQENNYHFGSEDEDAIRSYEDRGWCFVTLRIGAKPSGVGGEEGMIQAVILRFSSAEPVYPFALTASYDYETGLLLYVFADHKVEHKALTVKYASLEPFTFWKKEIEAPSLDVDGFFLPETYAKNPGFLTKLKGHLSKKNVKGDLVLKNAPDDSAYCEVRFGW